MSKRKAASPPPVYRNMPTLLEFWEELKRNGPGTGNSTPAGSGSGGILSGSGALRFGSGGILSGSGALRPGSGGILSGSGALRPGSGGILSGSGALRPGSGGILSGSGALRLGSGRILSGSGRLLSGSGKLLTGSGGSDEDTLGYGIELVAPGAFSRERILRIMRFLCEKDAQRSE